MFVAFGGSYAYGYASEYSDVRLCGCARNTVSDLLGRTRFDSYRDKQTNTVINSFNKTVDLLLGGDIAATELLHLEQKQYAMVSAQGQTFLDNGAMFLSQRVSDSYAGYIYALTQWLDKLQSRINLGTNASEKKLYAACEPMIQRFNKQLPKDGESAARLYLAASTVNGLPRELHMDMQIKDCPLRQYFEMLEPLQSLVRSYEKEAAQRKAVDAPLIAKKTVTLVRMLLTCCDLLESGRPVICRTQDTALLTSLRNGDFVAQDCKIKDELYDLVNPLLRRLEYDRANTQLPKEPDETAINEFAMEMNRKTIEAPIAPEPAQSA